MNTEQINLLNQANQELTKETPDLAAAEELMVKALSTGERYDLLLLTKGRILQKQDRCTEAKKLFEEINVAPHEPSQKVEDIQRIKNLYIEQMETICSAQLELTCATRQTTIKLGAMIVACGSTTRLKPGVYQLQARLGDDIEEASLELIGGESRAYRVGLIDRGSTPPEDSAETSPSWTRRYRKTLVSGVSTLALTGAATASWAVASSRKQSALDDFVDDNGNWRVDNDPNEQDEAEQRAQRLGNIEVASGFAIPVIAGVGLIATTTLWWLESSQDAQETNVSWHLGVAPGGASAGVKWRW